MKCSGSGQAPATITSGEIGKPGHPFYRRGKGRCPACNRIVVLASGNETTMKH